MDTGREPRNRQSRLGKWLPSRFGAAALLLVPAVLIGGWWFGEKLAPDDRTAAPSPPEAQLEPVAEAEPDAVAPAPAAVADERTPGVPQPSGPDDRKGESASAADPRLAALPHAPSEESEPPQPTAIAAAVAPPATSEPVGRETVPGSVVLVGWLAEGEKPDASQTPKVLPESLPTFLPPAKEAAPPAPPPAAPVAAPVAAPPARSDLDFPSPNKPGDADPKAPAVGTPALEPVVPFPFEPVVPFPWSVRHLTPGDVETTARYLDGTADPNGTLDLIQGRSRLLKLKQTPKSIHVTDEGIVGAGVVGKGVALHGRAVGSAVLHVSFPADDRAQETDVSLLVRVFPDQEARERYERTYKTLESDLRRTFPESRVQLQLVGNAVLVGGQVRDAGDAAKALQIVAANTPWAGKCSPGAAPGQPCGLASGSPFVVNMLQIPGTQRVVLKIVIAEMSRTAAQYLAQHVNDPDVRGAAPARGGLPAGCWGEIVCVPPTGRVPDGTQVGPAGNAALGLRGAKSLVVPQATTIRGQPATLLGGGEIPVPVPDGRDGDAHGVTCSLYGVELTFTGVCDDRNRIRLNVSAAATAGVMPAPFSSTVELASGQTAALTGFFPPAACTVCEPPPDRTRRFPFSRCTPPERAAAPDQEVVIFATPELDCAR